MTLSVKPLLRLHPEIVEDRKHHVAVALEGPGCRFKIRRRRQRKAFQHLLHLRIG